MASQFGLPPAILQRASPVSDKAQAILRNPFYLVTSQKQRLADYLFSFFVAAPEPVFFSEGGVGA